MTPLLCPHGGGETGVLCGNCRLANKYATNYAKDPNACPRCHGPLEDLSGSGFSAKQARSAYTCFRFNDREFECNGEPKW